MVHVEQRDHHDVIVELLAEGIREAGEAANLHFYVEILPLHIATRDVLFFRVVDDFYALGAKTLCEAVRLY